MRLQFSKREKITFLVVVLILVLYVVLLQFYFLSPLKTDLKGKQQTLQSEQKLVGILQKKSNDQTEDANTTELQKEVPVKPLQDQFILDLQQAEAVSNSQIKSMSFSEGGQAGEANNTQSTATANGTEMQSNSSSNTARSNASSSTNQQQTAQTANGASEQQNANAGRTTSTPALSKLTVQLSIQSPRYEDLEKFINTLEGLKRITVVEAINYTGNQEITSLSLSQSNKPMDYTLTISAFYLPGLTDLDKQLPKVDFPAPANKENPLSQFASTDSQLP